ncbi:hypothetical protein V490_03582 [Pseudogymnoascus sp. VKM F-3557]|nr:hypothetical protein V490_03582 [Pseudogymnoascus sp. VKM F-3557]
MIFSSFIISCLSVGAVSAAALDSAVSLPGHHGKRCIVKAGGSESIDDAPAVLEAFKTCGHNGNVVFSNTTYHINSVMKTTGLKNCAVDIYGTLLWGTNITYWLNNSLDVGYQNQSTAWILSGDRLTVDGHGHGTINGNGDVWYDFVGGVSNYPRRPHALTVANTTDSIFRGVRFIRSQMWTLSIIHSARTIFDSIYVNNTKTGGGHGANTDGADTIYSNHIAFNNWIVDNGDDSISMKANSTDISITNCTFHNGLGLAMGSIGQYKDEFETIERVYAKGLKFINTLHVAYFKTWTGEQVGYPPNGGGGGFGYAKDLHFSDIHLESGRGTPFTISQCTTFKGGGGPGNCTSSKFEISHINVNSVRGTTQDSKVSSFQCSAVKPCHDIKITDEHLVLKSNGTKATSYLCSNVFNTRGFNCTGPACEGASGTGGC